MNPKSLVSDLNISHILLSPRIGGAESLVDSLNFYWRNSVLHSDVLYLDQEGSDSKSRLMRLVNLFRSIRASKPDVVIAHSLIPSIYARMVTPLGTPIINVLHSAGDDFRSWKIRLIERVLSVRTAHVVAVSQHQMERYTGHFGKRSKISIIPNGIRPDIVSKTTASTSLQSLVTVSRVAEQKNPLLWIDVAVEIAKFDSTPRMTWWGPLSADLNVLGVVNDERVGKSVGRFMGPTDDPAARLLDSDALFHPSNREAHSIGILEAAAAGLPVVCSSSVATTLPNELVFVEFETGNSAAALGAIRELMESWTQLSRQAIAVADRIKDRYSIARCAEEYERLIRSVARL